MILKINNNWTEIIGLPGVGKTRYLNENRDKLKEEFHIINSKNQSFFEKIKYFLYFIRIANILDDKQLLKKLSYRLSMRPTFNKKKVLFDDSGIFQVLIENLIETNFKEVNKKINLFCKFTIPGNIIFINDDLKYIINREMNRKRRRFKVKKTNLTKRYKQALKFIQEKISNKIPNYKEINI